MKQLCSVIMLLSIVGLTSCMHDIEVREKPVNDVTDLQVPADFSWTMSSDILLSISSPVKTTVEVFTTENCEKGSRLAVLQAPVQDMPLSVANSVKGLYVRYTKKDGTKAVMSTGTVTRAATDLTVKLPEEAGEETISGGLHMNYPSQWYGTLLFEDNWPVKGDYDLNDIAAHYNIQLHLTSDKMVEAMIVSVKLTALGGTYPYQLCMRANNLKHSDAEAESYGSSSTGTYKVLSTGDEPFMVAYDWPGLKGSNGGAFYNTEEESLAASGSIDRNQVSFVIYMNELPISALPHDSFDFFIKRTDNTPTEIHLKGYEPTDAFKAGYAEEEINMGSAYYSTKDNFVWGIKVPVTIAHPKERISILDAYPDFAGWVTSGGVNNQDWYRNDVKENCVPLN